MVMVVTREPLGELVQVLRADIAPERPQAGVQVGMRA